MTEIKIEKKKSFWPWLFVLLGLAVAIYFLFFRNEESIVEDTGTALEVNDAPNNSTIVSEYVMFIANNADTLGLDHEFTSEAINKLTAAIESKAKEKNVDITTDITNAFTLSAQIKTDLTATDHSDKISEVAKLLSTALVKLQQQEFPDLAMEATQVNESANAIDPKGLTLNQRDAVKTFFEKAADLLKKMN